ncbi:hypothetical protein [Nocardioides sp. InS609-2]|nr:hypothetical protein [Nocardioides sp. InS609-2]
MPNPATAADNAFQRDVPEEQSDDASSAKALAETTASLELSGTRA